MRRPKQRVRQSSSVAQAMRDSKWIAYLAVQPESCTLPPICPPKFDAARLRVTRIMTVTDVRRPCLHSERCDDATNRVSNDPRQGMRHGAVRHLHDAEQSPMFFVNIDPISTGIAVPANPINVIILAAEVHRCEQPAIMAVSGNRTIRHD